jgi:hypothetical protein
MDLCKMIGKRWSDFAIACLVPFYRDRNIGNLLYFFAKKNEAAVALDARASAF